MLNNNKNKNNQINNKIKHKNRKILNSIQENNHQVNKHKISKFSNLIKYLRKFNKLKMREVKFKKYRNILNRNFFKNKIKHKIKK